MAVNEKDYVKSDSKVKAAQSKLTLAKSDLDKVKGSNLPGAQQRAAEFQSQIDAAQKELNAASASAKTYFAQNKEKIQTAADKKQAAKETKQNKQSAASIKNITESGYLSQEQIAGIQNAQSETNNASSAATFDNPSAGTTGIAATIDSVNKDLTAKDKDAAQLIHDMKPAERIALAKELTDAGIKTPDLKGLENPTLLGNYRVLLNQAKAYNTTNKDIKGFTPLDLTGFKSYKKELTAASGGGAGGTNTDTLLFTRERAASYINQEFQTYLSRDATPKEIADLTTKLEIAQKKNPSRTVTDSNGNRVTRQGLDAAGFLDSEIKKLPEYGKKLEAKVAPKTESILATAKANGILANQHQIDTWNQRIKNGEDVATIQSEIRGMAATGRPDNIAKQLAAGNNLDTVLSPYKQYMQQILEVPADQIDLNDKTLQMAIGGDKPMSLYDYQNALRKDPRWQYTNNAKTAVSDSISTVLKDFGFMG
jgi:hypothetical protein